MSVGDDVAYDPYAIVGTGIRPFWADAIADQIEAQAPSEPIVIKGGISPSGIPHLGNANELMLGWFVAEVLRERGYAVDQVFTTDDRDPLRKLPRKLADLDGNIVDLGDVDAGALGRNLGRPYTDIPSPFESTDSYGEHFSTLIADIADALDIDIEIVSNTALYESGQFDDAIRTVLEQRDRARGLLSEFQDSVDDSYVPFNPICEECGQLTSTVTAVDLAEDEVGYRCEGLTAGDQEIDGCGHEGIATIREGKLPWRFEWVAQWELFDVDFEPFGKDHAEGSWPSGTEIARELFGIDPPVPMAYEWFTLEGKPFSSSDGHVLLVSDALELIEPEVLRYFFAKDPTTARDFSIEHVDQLVNEFDQLEATYAGRTEETDSRQAFADRVYPFLVDEMRPDRFRIPYQFAAVLGMADDPEQRRAVAAREGHIPADASETAIEAALARVPRARRWAKRTDNEYSYSLSRETRPTVELDPATATALDEIAAFIEANPNDGEAIQAEIYDAARRHDIEVGSLFATGYRLFFDKTEGPRLGQFLAQLDTEFVVGRLRRED